MLFLHEPSGHYPVGASTFVTPAQLPRVIGSVKLASSNARTPFSALDHALKLEEIAFTAYYPADTSSTPKPVKGLNWLFRPLRETLRGYGHYSGVSRFILWPLLYLFGSLIKIPVYVNAPLLNPRVVEASKKDDQGGQWPLVIFSHGLGGGRTAYSQICSRLAASGRVVLALEHRDGSGPACIPRSWGPNSKTESKPFWYLRERDIRWPSEDHKAVPFPLRKEQVVFRRHEIYTAYNAFRRFVQNDPEVKMELMDDEPLERRSWSVLDEISKLPPVRCDSEVGFAGHSFGSCTLLSIMSTNPPSEYSRIPVSQALILDPWLEPLPTQDFVPSTSTRQNEKDDDKLTGEDDSTVRSEDVPRLLVLNSEVFSVWKDHFEQLREVMNVWEPAGGRIVTLIGCRHASFSDFFVLPLIRSAASRRYIKMIGDMSVAFFDNRIEKCLQEYPSRKMEIQIVGVKKDGKPRKKLVGTLGDIIIT